MKLSINADFTKLPRAHKVARAADAGNLPLPYDLVVLAHDERHLRRRVIQTVHDEKILVDLPEPMHLNQHDRLVLDDNRTLDVIASEEPLHEIRPRNALHLAGLCWHIGNRHLAAQIEEDRILILRDHVIKAMLEGLGATVTEISEPFEPVHGAYSGHGHSHDHGHNSKATSRANETTTGGCPAIRTMATTMPESRPGQTLLRLLTWMSPTFPVGAFAYSHGLERAIHDGLIHDRATLTEWLKNLVQHGSAWNDAVLLAESWREALTDRREAAQLGEAMAGSRERHMETTLQGGAFLAAAAVWPAALPRQTGPDMPYPVAVGLAGRAHGVPLESALTAYFHGFAANLVQAAMRLVPLGQSDGLAAIAALEETILDAAERASRSTLDDLGSATLISDIIAMKHETQYSRVFRS